MYPSRKKSRGAVAVKPTVVVLAALGVAGSSVLGRPGSGGPASTAAAFAIRQREKREQSPENTIRLNSDLVVVDASVVHRDGGYASDLSASDFEVLEDGSAQNVVSVSTEEAPFAAAILVDMSGSMEDKFGMVRGAAASFLEHLRDDDQVAVYGFNTKIRQFQDFSNLRDLSDYLWDVEPRDETRLYDCIETGVEALAKRAEKRRAILVISDGCDNKSGASLDAVLKKAIKEAVMVYAIDLTDDDLLIGSTQDATAYRQGRSYLQEMARQTGGRYVHSPDGSALESAFSSIVEELTNQYTLAYYSNNSKRDGRWRKIEVKVDRPGATVRARPGYYAPKA